MSPVGGGTDGSCADRGDDEVTSAPDFCSHRTLWASCTAYLHMENTTHSCIFLPNAGTAGKARSPGVTRGRSSTSDNVVPMVSSGKTTTCCCLAALCYDSASRKTPRLPAHWDTAPLSTKKAPGNTTRDTGLQAGTTTHAARGRLDWSMQMQTGRRARAAARGAPQPSFCERTAGWTPRTCS